MEFLPNLGCTVNVEHLVSVEELAKLFEGWCSKIPDLNLHVGDVDKYVFGAQVAVSNNIPANLPIQNLNCVQGFDDALGNDKLLDLFQSVLRVVKQIMQGDSTRVVEVKDLLFVFEVDALERDQAGGLVLDVPIGVDFLKDLLLLVVADAPKLDQSYN